MKTLTITIGLFFAAAAAAFSQSINGRVFEIVEGDTLPLVGAHVLLLDDHTHGSLTDANGRFELHTEGKPPYRVLVSHVSYAPDTIETADEIVDVFLQSGRSIGEVVVTARASDTYFEEGPMRTEVLTSTELKEAACCDLAGCFNRTASVERAVTDVLTDTKELRMLSLSGVYTQILVDNIPWLTNGLNQSFAVSHIPGTMINKIMVMKGLNSVVQGSESISGQVNVLTKNIEEENAALLNIFANSFLETQYNLNYSATMGRWSTIFAGHSTQHGADVDGDGDSFLDMPNTSRYMAFNKWNYAEEDGSFKAYIAGKYLTEERIGGQKGFNRLTDKGTMNAFGQILDMDRFEAYGKAEHQLGENQFLDALLAVSTQKLDGWYGTTAYTGKQLSFYGDIRYETLLSEENQLTIGAGYRHLKLDETIDLGLNPNNKTYGGGYFSEERIAGVFAEDQQNLFDDNMTVIAGIRADQHSGGGGFVVTPRLHMKYAFSGFTSIRGSIGTGHRNAHAIAENLVLMASSRNIVIEKDLKMEDALNYGFNLTHEYILFGIEGTLAFDAYRTVFTNQLRPVYDDDPGMIHFRNLNGRSYSNSIQTEVSAILTTQIDVKFAHTWSEVYEVERGMRLDLPFIPKHKLLATMSWATLEPDWRIDATLEWNGRQHLPETGSYPVEFQLGKHSDPYTMLGIQITKTWEYFDIYAGVENALNHRQNNPIISSSNPFGQYFEPTFIWGDTKGREAYAGIRWRLWALK